MHHHEPSRDVRTRLECEGSETRRTAPSLCGGGVDSRAIVLKSRLSFLKPGQGTVRIFCEHPSPVDESACHPKPTYLRQVERNSLDAGATIWRTTPRTIKDLPVAPSKSSTPAQSRLSRTRHSSLLLVHYSFFHHELNILQQLDVSQRIAVHRHHIRRLPRLDRADQIRMTKQVGRIRRCRLDCLHRCHPVLHHECELLRTGPIRAHS